MTQTGRATADVATGNWSKQDGSTTDLYQAVDEAVADNADYIQSGPDPSADVYRAALPVFGDPNAGTDHEFSYRIGKSGPGTVNLTVRLIQGASTVIAEWQHTDIAVGPTDIVQTLTSTQADAITDYADLDYQFEASLDSGIQPTNNLVAALGDSITNANASSGTDTYTPQLTDSANVGAYLTWAAILPKTGDTVGNGKFRWGKTYATGGFNTASIEATHLPQVLAANPKPSFVVVLAGANDGADIGTGGTVDTVKLATWRGRMENILDSLIANGQIPIVGNLIPNDTANTRVGLAAMRTEIADMISTRPDCISWDVFTPLDDGTGAFAAGMSNDGIHPSTTGAKLMGQALRDVVDPFLLAEFPTLPTVATQNDETFLLMNGAFSIDTDADGIPDGGQYPYPSGGDLATLTAAGAALSLAPQTGFEGNAMTVAKSATGTSQLLASSTLVPVSGKRYGFGFVMEQPVVVASGSIIMLAHKATDGAVSFFRLNLRVDAGYTEPIAPFAFWIEDAVPADFGKATIYLWQTSTNGVTFRLGQFAPFVDLDVDLGALPVTDNFDGRTAGLVLWSYAPTTGGGRYRRHVDSSTDILISNAGRIRNNNAALASLVYHTATPATGDVDITFDLIKKDNAGTQQMGVMARVQPEAGGDSYRALVVLGATDQFRIVRKSGGVITTIGSFNNEMTIDQVYACRYLVQGDVHKLFIDSVERISVTDGSPIASTGYVGLIANGAMTDTTGVHLDNFSATDA